MQPAEAHFSSAGLVERLHEPPPPTATREDAKAYRELYMTIGGVLLLLLATIIYQLSTSSNDPEAPVVIPVTTGATTPPSPDPAPATSATNTPAPTVPRAPNRPNPGRSIPAPRPQSESPPRKAEKKPKNSATPMLSVVSTPRDAIVSIDGVVYGRTPIIMPSPQNAAALKINLKLPGFKQHTEVLTRNAAGHFSLNVKLQPR